MRRKENLTLSIFDVILDMEIVSTLELEIWKNFKEKERKEGKEKCKRKRRKKQKTWRHIMSRELNVTMYIFGFEKTRERERKREGNERERVNG